MRPMDRWHEWDYVELFMDVFWEISGGKELLRPSWRRCPCQDVLAVLGALHVLPGRGVEPANAVEFLRIRMAKASPKALSDATGYSREYLSRLKSGRRRSPTFEAFVRIVLALEIGFPLLASITPLRRDERASQQPKKKRPKQRTKRSSKAQQHDADDFWGFRITFWYARVRDLEALRRGEVTVISGQVTHPNQREVTPGDREVTRRERQVTRARRPEVTPGDREVTRREGRNSAGEGRTFVAYDCEEDNPSPEFNALMRELAESAPYPMTLARVAETLDARAQAKARQARDRGGNPQGRRPDAETNRPADGRRGARAAQGASDPRPSGERIPVVFRGVRGYFVPAEPEPEP